MVHKDANLWQYCLQSSASFKQKTLQLVFGQFIEEENNIIAIRENNYFITKH